MEDLEKVFSVSPAVFSYSISKRCFFAALFFLSSSSLFYAWSFHIFRLFLSLSSFWADKFFSDLSFPTSIFDILFFHLNYYFAHLLISIIFLAISWYHLERSIWNSFISCSASLLLFTIRMLVFKCLVWINFIILKLQTKQSLFLGSKSAFPHYPVRWTVQYCWKDSS